MSISLNLVIYKHEDNKLIEENLRTVRCEEVSQALLVQLTDSFPMKTVEVYFDNEFKDSFEIECFDNLDIENIIGNLKKHFHELLSYEYNELITKSTSSVEQDSGTENSIVDILSDENHQNPTELAIARFRILTGVIGIFMDKKTKLSDEIGAVIKLG